MIIERRKRSFIWYFYFQHSFPKFTFEVAWVFLRIGKTQKQSYVFLKFYITLNILTFSQSSLYSNFVSHDDLHINGLKVYLPANWKISGLIIMLVYCFILKVDVLFLCGTFFALIVVRLTQSNYNSESCFS